MRFWWWFGYASGALLALSALAAVTFTARQLEADARQSRELAGREEAARLVLWRMDAELSPLIARETARPWFAYQAFYPVDRALSRLANPLQTGEILLPSPLLLRGSLTGLQSDGDGILLHAELRSDGRLLSPQVPIGIERRTALGEGFTTLEQLGRAEQRLSRLREVLGSGVGAQTAVIKVSLLDQGLAQHVHLPRSLNRLPVPDSALGNSGLNVATCQTNDANGNLVAFQTVAPQSEEPLIPAQTAVIARAAVPQRDPPQMQQRAQDEQQARNSQSRTQRQGSYSSNYNQAVIDNLYDVQSNRVQWQSSSQLVNAVTTSATVPGQNEIFTTPPASAVPLRPDPPPEIPLTTSPPALTPRATDPTPIAAPTATTAPVSVTPAAIARPAAPPASMPSLAIGVMHPRFLGSELLLARELRVDGERIVQVCWLDWSALGQRLLTLARQELPDAQLVPVDEATTLSSALLATRQLATLPVRLEPGLRLAQPVVHPAALAPSLLAFAWAAVLIALIAVAIALHRALAVADRRRAFVAAVTHELRTPLTTLRLYADLLAGDLAPAERPSLLATLRSEAGRLGHLVDNVLDYARLERRPPRRRSAPVTLASILDRAVPTLRARLAQVGLALDLCIAPEQLATGVLVDPKAIERVLDNLIDNAAKYAAPPASDLTANHHAPDARPAGTAGANDHVDAAPAPVRNSRCTVALTCRSDERFLILRLRDHGPGLAPDAQRRLFTPFAKSAETAAASAPGIGLGLALCRRCCRDQGGDLRHVVPDDGPGACFEVFLPR